MQQLLRFLGLLLASAALLRPGEALAQDAGGAFSCDGIFYQTRQSGTGTAAYSVLYRVDRSATPYVTNPLTGGTYGTTGTLSINGTKLLVNALAYNSQNGYLYAVSYPADNGTPPATSPHIYQIGLGGVKDLGVTNLPVSSSFAAGTFDKNGNYYLAARDANQNNLYRINVANNALAATAVPLQAAGTTTSTSPVIYDLAYNPVDNKLYGVVADGLLYRITLNATPATVGSVEIIGTQGTQIIGSAFFDISGRLYAYSNGNTNTANSGLFYIVNTDDGSFTQLSTIEPVASSDGASCINPLQRIDVTKTATSVVPVSATTFDVTYTIRVINSGTVTDPYVQVSDLLKGTGATAANTTFPTASSVTLQAGPTVTNLDGSSLAASTGFTGVSGSAALLTGSQGLTAGQRATITYTVRVAYPAGQVPSPSTAQNNTAYGTVTATSDSKGMTQASNGTLLTPSNLEAYDASTNSTAFAPLRANLTDVGDTPAPTPIYLPPSITGVVFEDVNYGGGLGRSLSASAGVPRSGARVELYTASTTAGVTTYNYTSAQLTAADGSYAFINLAAGANYVVRVVNSSVTSSRAGYTTGLLPVQTYRTSVTAAAGTVPDPNRVGGEYPGRTDAGNGGGTTSTTLASLTPAVGTTAAESISYITLAAANAPATSVDFGYNFDTVVNTNDTGQGSLRQFITNANALSNNGLDQVAASTGGNDPAAGVETSIFMVPSGAAVPGLAAYDSATGPNAGLASQLTGGVAVITPATALPALGGTNGASTSLDGTTQTQNVGNTNNVNLGAGGTVGTGATTLAQVNGPEVQLTGNTNLALGLDIASTATNTTLKGLAIYGFGNATNDDNNALVRSNAGGLTITQSVLGSAATAFSAPTTTNTTTTNANALNIVNNNGGSVTISNNLIGFVNGKGIAVGPGVIGASITGNEVRGNDQGNGYLPGLDIQGRSTVVSGNLFAGNAGEGISSYNSNGGNNISGNTVTGNGVGTTTTGPVATSGINVYGPNNTVSQNVVANNYGAGIMLNNAASTTTISQNSIYGNGAVTSLSGAAASGDIGIDLQTSTQTTAAGTAPYVTLNSTATNGSNGLVNYPIITSASVVGTNLLVQGYAKAGAVIELFTAQANPSALNASGANFGQGKTYLTTATEGNTSTTAGPVDANTRTGLSYSGLINGFNQGTDTNANGFSFSIPLSSLPGGTLALGTLVTATSTLGGATSEFSGNAVVNQGPTANNVTNAAVLTTSAAAVLNPNLSATPNGAGVTIASYTLVTLPASGQGTLYYNGTAATAGQVITDLTKLTFAPTSGFSGNASFTYSATDSNGAPSNVATYTIPVTPVADVATSFPGTNATTATVGGSLALTVNFTNNGPNDAAGLTRSVQLPAGLTTTGGTVTVSNGTGTYVNATGLLTLTGVTTLANGTTLSPVITISTIPVGTSSLTAVSVISTTSNEGGITANNTASTTVAVAPRFDLATTITGPTSFVAGSQATYTVTTANNGPSALGAPAEGTTLATGAVQTVQLPTGLSGVFATNGGVYNSSTGVVTFPDVALASGQVATNTISFSVAAATSFSVQATVAKTSSLLGTDTNGANDTAYLNGSTSAAATTVTAPTSTTANVYVTATGPAQVAGGGVATYTITQGNYGPLAASGVQTQVSLPTGLTGSTLTLTDNGTTATVSSTTGGVITFSDGAKYTQATGVLVLPALTAAQNSAATPQTYTLGIIAPTTALNAAMTVTASVASTTSDTMPANNVATVETEIQPTTDVTIALSNVTDSGSLSNGNILAGQTASFAVQASNLSTNPARNVQQRVALPASLDASTLRVNGTLGTLSNGVYTFANGATYTPSTSALASTGTLTLPTLANLMGGAIQTTLVSFAAPDPNGVGVIKLPLAAAISTSTPETNAANNAATLAPNLVAAQDVAVSLSGPAQAVVGNPVLYTVSTTNNGPAANGNQQTSVTLPTALDPTTLLLNNVASSSNANGVYTFAGSVTYNSSTGVVTYPSTGIPKTGQSTVNTIQFVAPNVTLLNAVATVVPPSNDPNSANNTAQVITPLSTSALSSLNLGTGITSSATTGAVGASSVFTVTTTNASTTVAATGVTQTLVLPAGLTSNGGTVTTNGGVYNNQTGVVTFAVGTLGAGSSVQNSATISLPPSPTGSPNTYTLTATGSSFTANPETTLSDNTVTTTVSVTPKYDLTTTISGPTAAPAGSTVTYAVSLANAGPASASNVTGTFTLPAGVTSYTATSQVIVSGSNPAVATSTTYTGVSGTVTFRPSASLLAGQVELWQISFAAPSSTYVATSGIATSSTVAETNVLPNSASLTTVVNQAPVAYDVVNKQQTPQGPLGNSAGPMPLTALNAADTDGGAVASYTLVALPTSNQGVLYYNGAVATTGQSITDPTKLSFDPASGFVGNAFFTYTATDNGNSNIGGSATYALTSAPARYTIPVGADNSSVAMAATQVKGGSNPYVNGDILAYVVDTNGAQYTANAGTTPGIVYNATTGALQSGAANGLASAVLAASGSGPSQNPTNALPSGVSLDPVTGQLKVDNSKGALPAIVAATTYYVNVITTDVYGGTNVVTESFTLGAYPLPVELVKFDAQAVQNRDAQLSWITASELNNAHFTVERSLDGVSFTKVGQVAGQGSKATATTYAFTDAGIGPKVASGQPVYYRLQQVDVDGKASYSPVRSVSFTKQAALVLTLYPNPASSATGLDLSALPTTGTYQVLLLDATGRQVRQLSLGGGLVQNLELSDLATGTYQVLVSGQRPDGSALHQVLRLIKE